MGLLYDNTDVDRHLVHNGDTVMTADKKALRDILEKECNDFSLDCSVKFSCFSPTTLAKWETVNTDHLRELPLCPVVTSTGLLSRLLLHKDTVGMRSSVERK